MVLSRKSQICWAIRSALQLLLRVWYWAENCELAEKPDQHSSCRSGYDIEQEITNLLNKQMSTPAVAPGMVLSWKSQICWTSKSALQLSLRVWYWAGNCEFAEEPDQHSSCHSGCGTEQEITNLLSKQMSTLAVAPGMVLSRKSQIFWATRSALQQLLRVWYWAGDHEFAEQADEHSSCCSGYGTEPEITNLLSNQIGTPAVAQEV